MGAVDILIVEDDEKLAGLLLEFLTQERFHCAACSRGDEAIERIAADNPKVVLLDVMLPGIDGMEVCRRVRGVFGGAILMLTARKSDSDEILGLDLGADDYVTKPVYPRTLLARIKNLLRRTSETASPDLGFERTVGDLYLHWRTKEARVGSEVVSLTPTEFLILWMLADHPGEVVTRDALYRRALNVEYDGLDRGIDIHISRIRHKLESSGLSASVIRSIRGSGYVLAIG